MESVVSGTSIWSYWTKGNLAFGCHFAIFGRSLIHVSIVIEKFRCTTSLGDNAMLAWRKKIVTLEFCRAWFLISKKRLARLRSCDSRFRINWCYLWRCSRAFNMSGVVLLRSDSSLLNITFSLNMWRKAPDSISNPKKSKVCAQTSVVKRGWYQRYIFVSIKSM